MKKLLLLLSLSIILLTLVYAWVNRYHYYDYSPNEGFVVIIRENIFTMDRCTLRLGANIEALKDGDYSRSEQDLMDASVFPDFCKDTPEN